MKLSLIKSKMLKWKDIYGADIPWSDDIKKSKNKEQLAEFLNRYNRLIEDTATNAIRDCDEFRRELGLSY